VGAGSNAGPHFYSRLYISPFGPARGRCVSAPAPLRMRASSSAHRTPNRAHALGGQVAAAILPPERARRRWSRAPL